MAQEIADSTLLDTWGSDGNIVEPDISKIIEGWQLGEQPPHEYMNWLQNTFGSKLNHILKNGVASWNNETEYLVGSSVQHNGNVWLCKITNTNSAPTDANANWKIIITVESLTTVLNGYVNNTGNETIAGVKTFNSLPKTNSYPPTNDFELVPKKYVDVLDSANVKLDGNQIIAGVITFNSIPKTNSFPPTNDFELVPKKYVDDNIAPEYNPTPTIVTGTATFTATTNNINLTGIGIGVEIGDVIQISGAEDAKNNSEFTVEVITDNNNIIVNQAHANKGTSKNVANRSNDTGVTVKLLAKWFNAPIGLGQGWVENTTSRVSETTYPNNTKRAIKILINKSSTSVTTLTIGSISFGGDTVNNTYGEITIPVGESYSYTGSIVAFRELR